MVPKAWKTKLSSVLCILALMSSCAFAGDMRFEFGGTLARCADCGWIQGTGEITASTPNDFEQFVSRLKFYPKVLRLQSNGGDVRASIEFGKKLRAGEFSTEIGRAHV